MDTAAIYTEVYNQLQILAMGTAAIYTEVYDRLQLLAMATNKHHDIPNE